VSWTARLQPVAEIRFLPRLHTVTSGEGEKFSFQGLQPGTYSLTVMRAGFAEFAEDLVVGPNGQQEVSVKLGPALSMNRSAVHICTVGFARDRIEHCRRIVVRQIGQAPTDRWPFHNPDGLAAADFGAPDRCVYI